MPQAYFVSDIHLKRADEPNAIALARFLGRLREQVSRGEADAPSHLFLVGDIFDLWIGSHDYFHRKFSDLVSRVRDLADAGVQVHYFEGNHDLHLDRFWTEEVGARVHTEPTYFELFGQTIRVEHGDLIDPEDKGYLFLRWLLRTKAMRQVALNLPAAAIQAIGERASHVSRARSTTREESSSQRILKIIAEHAERAFAEKPYDLLVAGHVHKQVDAAFEAGGQRARYVNLGSWMDTPRGLVLDGSGARFFDI